MKNVLAVVQAIVLRTLSENRPMLEIKAAFDGAHSDTQSRP